MISQSQKIDCRAFVGEKYFRFFRNNLFQQNQISRLTPYLKSVEKPLRESPIAVSTHAPITLDICGQFSVRQPHSRVFCEQA